MHETAFILSGVLVSLSIGLAIGYVGYKITGRTLNFHGWLTNEYYGHPPIWAIGGALVAMTATYFKYKL